MEAHIVGITVLLFILVAVNGDAVPFDRNYIIVWSESHVKVKENGSEVELNLDQSSGTTTLICALKSTGLPSREVFMRAWALPHLAWQWYLVVLGCSICYLLYFHNHFCFFFFNFYCFKKHFSILTRKKKFYLLDGYFTVGFSDAYPRTTQHFILHFMLLNFIIYMLYIYVLVFIYEIDTYDKNEHLDICTLKGPDSARSSAMARDSFECLSSYPVTMTRMEYYRHITWVLTI